MQTAQRAHACSQLCVCPNTVGRYVPGADCTCHDKLGHQVDVVVTGGSQLCRRLLPRPEAFVQLQARGRGKQRVSEHRQCRRSGAPGRACRMLPLRLGAWVPAAIAVLHLLPRPGPWPHLLTNLVEVEGRGLAAIVVVTIDVEHLQA